MRKLNFLFLAMIMIAPALNLKAQIPNLPAGSVATPQISTSESPIWYNLLSSHLTVSDRQNRFLALANDGAAPTTEKFDGGIPEASQNDKYLWRLEAGASGAGYAYLVNKASGKRLYINTGSASNSQVTADYSGVEWKYQTSASTGQTGTTPNQYVFNFTGNSATLNPSYLNAADATNAFKLVIYNMGAHQASGWFLYQVNTTKTVTFDQPSNGTVAVRSTNGTSSLSPVTSGGSVIIGTQVTVDLTPNTGCALLSLNVNGTDVTAQVASNQYKFFVNANATIAATFSVATATKTIVSANEVYPNPFKNSLKVGNALKGSKICLVDMNGKEILSTTESSINTSKVQKGNYILKYQSAEGTKTTKVVKE